MHRGYVRDYRKGIEHPLFSRPLIWHFWTYCRLRANHKEVLIDFNGLPLKLERGCFVMSVGSASKDTGLTTQNIRTAIKILSSHGMIEKSTSEVTKQATIVRVLKYDVYQDLKKDANKVTNEQLTKCQQGANKVLTTDNNVNNVENEEKNYSEDSNEFRLAVFLLNNIRKRKPDFKIPNLQTWSKQSDYILRIDRRDIGEVKKVVMWCQADEFWQDNILSTAKLRKQYDQLVLKMNKETANGIQSKKSATLTAIPGAISV